MLLSADGFEVVRRSGPVLSDGLYETSTKAHVRTTARDIIPKDWVIEA